MTSDAAVGTDDQLVKAGVHRAGRRLVPLLVLLYFVNYLDRVTIGFALPPRRASGWSTRWATCPGSWRRT